MQMKTGSRLQPGDKIMLPYLSASACGRSTPGSIAPLTDIQPEPAPGLLRVAWRKSAGEPDDWPSWGYVLADAKYTVYSFRELCAALRHGPTSRNEKPLLKDSPNLPFCPRPRPVKSRRAQSR